VPALDVPIPSPLAWYGFNDTPAVEALQIATPLSSLRAKADSDSDDNSFPKPPLTSEWESDTGEDLPEDRN
jgi:hypothetical protein